MAKYFVWNIGNVFEVFSNITCNRDFDFSSEKSDTKSNFNQLSSDDLILGIKNDCEIFTVLKVNKVEKNKLKLMKLFETFNTVNAKNFNIIIKENQIQEISLTNFEIIRNSLMEGKVNQNEKVNLNKVVDFPMNRIIFGAPGTGKSYKLAQDAEANFINTSKIDIKALLYDEIHSQPSNVDQGEWITSLGIKYSDYIIENYVNNRKQQDLVTDFDLLDGNNPTTKKKEQLVQGAKAGHRLHLNIGLKNVNSNIERVTFHPNYSYSQFVGTYKPVKSNLNQEEITYEYIPGPFMRVYANAKRNPEKNFLLLIEEINRANVAAVFGDVFQLLDRKSDGSSRYPINASEDQKNYLESCGINEDEIAIPSNMYIWATMNSADQGVLPMDAAFKRRWDFEYLDIDNEDAVNAVKDIKIPIKRDDSAKVMWNEFRTKLNEKLSDIGVNEDKLLGPFFLSEQTLKSAENNPDSFIELFESKVIMYLFEDVVKMNPGKLFNTESRRYSKICQEFEEKGMTIFGIEVAEV